MGHASVVLETVGVADFGLRPTDPKCWGRRFGFCSEGPRTGVEHDTRDPSVTKVLGVLRIATRAL